MNLFEVAQEWLSSRVHSEDDPGQPWSVEAGLRVACGCHPKLLPIAYWEYPDLESVLREAKGALGGQTQLNRWVEVTDLNWPEIRDRLEGAAETSNLQVPPEPRRRPWVDPNVMSTGRIPFLPIAAFCHLALLNSPQESLAHTLDELGFAVTTDPWTMLSTIDPLISGTAAPGDVASLARRITGLRSLSEELEEQDVSVALRTPAHLLFHAAQRGGAVRDLHGRLPAAPGETGSN